jgi:hypothetical protein
VSSNSNGCRRHK